MNRSRALRGFSVALFALTGGLAAAFAGCGGSGTSSATTSGATTSTGSDATSTTTTSTGATTTGAGGATTSSGSSSSTSGSGGDAPCPGCTAVATLRQGSAPYGLAVDANNVYWTNSGTHEIMQAKADGTSPLALATMQSTPFAVHVVNGFVYWVSYSVDGVMRKTPIGGGAISDIVEAPAARDLAVGTTHIWWTREPDDLQRVPIEGIVLDSGTVDLLSLNPLSNGITSDATSVYWVNRQDGYIKRVDHDFGFETPLASGDIPWDIEVDATHVYWTEQGSSPGVGKVMRASKVDGSEGVTIASNQAGPQGLAIDATSVYWANKEDGTIHKAPLAGGADVVLASGQLTPANVVVSDTHVYWTDPKADLVVRVAK
ncbi:MAG: hypothetical protein ABI134_10590 [Byssovorax sp.]